MKRILNRVLIAFSIILVAVSVSCKKKCDLGEDATSGEIQSEVSVFAESGYMTASMSPDEYLINANSSYADQFKISKDRGITKTEVDYTEYNILCYPMTVNCFAQFDRNVLIDDENGVIKYTIKVKDCGKCEEQRYVENYIVIRAVPDYYTVTYDVDIQTVD